MKRTKLSERQLPNYTYGEELMNMITHIVGGAAGIIMFVMCTIKSIQSNNGFTILSAVIYVISLISVYTISSIYHGLRSGHGKKVLQVIDHCMIYLLIAGTYTPILINAFIPTYPVIGYGLLIFQWSVGIMAAILTAIDLKTFKVFSMICYILMGWSVIIFLPQALTVLGDGFLFILWGGIAYTVGAILFGIGAMVHWIHAIFHIFVILGSILQFLGIYIYVL